MVQIVRKICEVDFLECFVCLGLLSAKRYFMFGMFRLAERQKDLMFCMFIIAQCPSDFMFCMFKAFSAPEEYHVLYV
jgi:hypothetical protein